MLIAARPFVPEFRDEIKKLLKNFLLDENKVNHAHKSLEDSMETRQQAEQKLDTCKNLTPLEKKIKDLSVVPLNRQVRITGLWSHLSRQTS